MAVWHILAWTEAGKDTIKLFAPLTYYKYFAKRLHQFKLLHCEFSHMSERQLAHYCQFFACQNLWSGKYSEYLVYKAVNILIQDAVQYILAIVPCSYLELCAVDVLRYAIDAPMSQDIYFNFTIVFLLIKRLLRTGLFLDHGLQSLLEPIKLPDLDLSPVYQALNTKKSMIIKLTLHICRETYRLTHTRLTLHKFEYWIAEYPEMFSTHPLIKLLLQIDI